MYGFGVSGVGLVAFACPSVSLVVAVFGAVMGAWLGTDGFGGRVLLWQWLVLFFADQIADCVGVLA